MDLHIIPRINNTAFVRVLFRLYIMVQFFFIIISTFVPDVNVFRNNLTLKFSVELYNININTNLFQLLFLGFIIITVLHSIFSFYCLRNKEYHSAKLLFILFLTPISSLIILLKLLKIGYHEWYLNLVLAMIYLLLVANNLLVLQRLKNNYSLVLYIVVFISFITSLLGFWSIYCPETSIISPKLFITRTEFSDNFRTFINRDFQDITFLDVSFRNLMFKNDSFNEISFVRSKLSNITFEYCRFNNCNFTNCNLKNVFFSFSSLRKGNFFKCFFKRTLFPDRMLQSSFKSCNFFKEYLDVAGWRGVRIEDSKLILTEIGISGFYLIAKKHRLQILIPKRGNRLTILNSILIYPSFSVEPNPQKRKIFPFLFENISIKNCIIFHPEITSEESTVLQFLKQDNLVITDKTSCREILNWIKKKNLLKKTGLLTKGSIDIILIAYLIDNPDVRHCMLNATIPYIKENLNLPDRILKNFLYKIYLLSKAIKLEKMKERNLYIKLNIHQKFTESTNATF